MYVSQVFKVGFFFSFFLKFIIVKNTTDQHYDEHVCPCENERNLLFLELICYHWILSLLRES